MKIKLKNVLLLKELMIKNGFTQRSFADSISVSESYIYNILKGQALGPKTANRICEKLNVLFDEIFLIENLTKVS